MKIFIGLVTPDEALRRYYGMGKDGVVPKDSISRGFYATKQACIFMNAYTPKGPASTNDLERFVLSRTTDTVACVMLIDLDWVGLAVNIRNSSLSVVFDRQMVNGNYRNFFHKVVGKILRALGILAVNFKNGDDAQLLMLPLRNFHAKEHLEIARICRDKCTEPNFVNDVQRQLGLLHNRRRPRRRTVYKTVYTIDDKMRFFTYGKEIHSRFATGAPHGPSCELNGHFRYGIRIDARRHFNVSETEGDITKIEGEFTDCHGIIHVVNNQTHLNMFSNDYF